MTKYSEILISVEYDMSLSNWTAFEKNINTHKKMHKQNMKHWHIALLIWSWQDREASKTISG